MPPAARVSDITSHAGTIDRPGVTTVIICKKPAAVSGTNHLCGLPPPAGPHSPTPIGQGSRTVLIGGKPAARIGDPIGCGAQIISGAPDVLIGG